MKEFAHCEKHMGTEVSVSVVTDTEEHAKEMMAETYASIRSYAGRFSRFLPDNELSHLNNTKNQIVSKEFFTILQKSYALYEKTRGSFNPLLQIARYGYNQDFNKLPDQVDTVNHPEEYDADFSKVIMDPETRRVILRKGQKIDLGGILKGYVSDKLSCNLSEKYPHSTGNIVNIGGDLHTEGVDAMGKPFEFFILNPVTKTETAVTISNSSLATSGLYKRVWKTSSGLRHHILTSDSTHDTPSVCSASVVHKEGVVTEAYTKLFLDREINRALEIIGEDEILYLLVHKDGKVETNI